MKKLLLSLILSLIALFAWPTAVQAVDITVTCDDSDCVMTPAPGTALFEEDDVKPGDNYNRKITVTNNGKEPCELILQTKNEKDPNGFGGVLFTNIHDSGGDYFGHESGGRATSDEALSDLFAFGPLNLGTLAASGGNKVFDWLASIDTTVGNEFQKKRVDFDFDLYFTCGEPSGLRLLFDKTNDWKLNPRPLTVGDFVNYTLTITNPEEETIYHVEVKDVQPVGEYFDYKEDSGHLKCVNDPDNTDTDINSSGSNPYYWQIGDLAPAEVCTLTYQLEILSTAIPGTHHNIAFAKGFDKGGGAVFSNVVDDPFDVGQKGELSGKLPVGGAVLGAATGEVLGAATGSKTFWLILAAILMAAGFILRRISKRASNLLVFFMVVGTGLSLTSKPALAVDNDPPVVDIVQLPEYTNKRDFEISYTALDGGEAGLKNVHLEVKKDGEGWNDLGTYSEESRKVSTANKIHSDGKYHFQATACDNNNNCAVSQTSTNVDTTAPPPPENYGKSRTGGSSYRITWHNPDSDDLNWVYIYRSDKADFTADDGTKIGNVSANKNTNGEFNDSGLDSQKEYYYALRNVDKAGNGSSLVGDIVVTTTQASPTSQVVSGQGAVPGQIATAQGGGGGGQILGTEEATPTATVSPQPETVTLPSEAGKGEVKGLAQALAGLPKWLLITGVVLLLFLGTWFFSRRRQ